MVLKENTVKCRTENIDSSQNHNKPISYISEVFEWDYFVCAMCFVFGAWHQTFISHSSRYVGYRLQSVEALFTVGIVANINKIND